MNTASSIQQRALHWLGRQLFNTDRPETFLDPIAGAINPMWLQAYTPAQVEQIRQDTHDTRTFVLRPARRWGGFQAGQHVNICTEINGQRLQRTFSLSCAPDLWRKHGRITLTIKRHPGGRLTNHLHDRLSVGDTLGLSEAFGDFLLPEQPKPLLMIAGGSGITPMLSQLESLAADHRESPVTLLYYVRSENDIIAREALEALATRWPVLDLQIITTDTSQPPRYLNDADLAAVPGLLGREVYLCGPKGLMDLAISKLHALGLPEHQRHCTFFAPPSGADLNTGALGGAVTFSHSQRSVTAQGDANLLDIAEAAGLRPQHGCRMGICHQCSCRKTRGTVINRLTGKASGPGNESVQLCVSIPQGDVALDL
ncbi:MAG: ferredoxin reductase [Pseudomonadota bacterium]|nr:ferredoxin reductase [Pseudomonadota bacterium]